MFWILKSFWDLLIQGCQWSSRVFYFMCILDSFGFYLTRSKCTNIFWRKKLIVRCLKYNYSSAGFCHRVCLLLCVNPSQNAFKGWLAKNVSCCKLSEQAFFPFSLDHAIRGGGFVMESWAAHWYSKQCKVQREQSVAAQTQLEYWFEFLGWTWLCLGCRARRKRWISKCAVQQLGHFWSNFWDMDIIVSPW